MFNRKMSYGLAVLSGILLLLSFPPFNLEFLAWIAYVPLLLAIYYTKDTKRVDRLTFISSLFLFPVVWVVVRGPISEYLPSFISLWLVPVSAVIVSQYLTVFVRMFWKKKQSTGEGLSYLPPSLQIIVLPVAWTSIEFLIMSLPIVMKVGGAFGFFSIAKTQWLNVPVLQLASFTGMHGVTFLILLVNCAVALAIIHYNENKKVYKPAIVVFMVLLTVFAYGLISVPEQTPGGVMAAIIQADPMGRGDMANLYVTLSNESLQYKPKFIMWAVWVNSSSSLVDPHHYFEGRRLIGPYVDEHKDFCQKHNVYLIGTGGYAVEKGMLVLPVMVHPSGHVSMHHITYLVSNLLDGLIPPFDFQTALFPRVECFETEFGKMGFLNCQETSYPTPARRTVIEGAQFIAGESPDPPWHFHVFPWLMGGNMVYRAVENGVGTASFYQGEASIIIDPYGRIVNEVSTSEMVVGKLFFSNKNTFYAIYGDVFGWSLVALMAVLSMYNLYLKKKSPFKYCIYKNCRAQIERDAQVCTRCGRNQKKAPLWKRIIFHEYYERKYG